MPDFLSSIIDRYESLKYSLLEAQTFSTEHYGFPDIYYKIMETDYVRVKAFTDTFEHYNNLKDKVVCEVGAGTLPLTRHYLPHVKKAYLIENNPNLREYIQNEINQNGWQDKVELIFEDAFKVTLPEKVDFVIGELMSIFCANEYQVQIFQHMRQFLKEDGKLIPEKIVNLAQLTQANFDKNIKHYPLLFTRHWPTQLSTQEVINVIDLYEVEQTKINVITEFKSILSGSCNSLLLNSFVQLVDGVNFTGTDSLMPPTLIKLEEEVKLQSRDRILIQSNYEYGTSLDIASFKALKEE